MGWNEGWKQGIFRKIEKKMDFFWGLLLLVFLPFTNLSKVFFFFGFYLGGRVGVSSCCNLLVIFPFANLSKVWSFGFWGGGGGGRLFCCFYSQILQYKKLGEFPQKNFFKN